MKPVNVKLSKPPQSSFKFKKIQLKSLEFNWHYHPEYEIMFMVHSRGKRFIGDNIAYYEEGDLFMIGPNLPHTWYSPPGVLGKRRFHEAILIQFRENFAGLNIKEVPELVAVQQLLNDASRGLQITGKTHRKVSRKILEMEKADGLDRFIILLTILGMLAKAPREDKISLSGIEFTHPLQPKEQSRIDKVCTFINENYKEPLRLRDAASIANMSTTAFSRFFKKYTGKTFINYVNELRIGWACKLLIETEMTVAEIAYEVGFNNLSNFNRRFYERHKMSPRRYRQEFGARY